MSVVDQGQFPAPNPNQEVDEQIPHSGVEGHELPVTEFDKTTPKDAVDQGLVTIPESPAALETPTRIAPTEAPKRGRGRLIGGIVAGTAIVGGAAGFMMTKGGGSESDIAERPAATAAPSPTAPVETNPGAPVVIPATQTPTTAEVNAAPQTATAPGATEAPTTVATTVTEEAPATTLAPASQENPVAEGESYAFLTTQQSELLSVLAEKGYPDSVVGHYEFDPADPSRLLYAVAGDIAAAHNLNDVDAYADMSGRTPEETPEGREGLESRFAGIDRFYALDPEYFTLKSCDDRGATVSCEGWVFMYGFFKDSDLNDPDTISFIENPSYGEGMPPSSAGTKYIEVSFTLDTTTGKLTTGTYQISEDQPY